MKCIIIYRWTDNYHNYISIWPFYVPSFGLAHFSFRWRHTQDLRWRMEDAREIWQFWFYVWRCFVQVRGIVSFFMTKFCEILSRNGFSMYYSLSLLSFCEGECLVCYKCKYERTLSDCLANGVTTCKGEDNACFREEAEILRRHGPRVVSAGCGRSWRSANSCDDHTGKIRCVSWCHHNLCNGQHVKLAKIGNSALRLFTLPLVLSLMSPLLLAYILYFH